VSRTDPLGRFGVRDAAFIGIGIGIGIGSGLTPQPWP
jgi:hypothetical protein